MTKAAAAALFFSSAAVASSFSPLRPAITTGCPPLAKRRARAAPSPCQAPTPTMSTLLCAAGFAASLIASLPAWRLHLIGRRELPRLPERDRRQQRDIRIDTPREPIARQLAATEQAHGEIRYAHRKVRGDDQVEIALTVSRHGEVGAALATAYLYPLDLECAID